MGTVRMSDLLEQARAFDPSKAEPRTTSWAPLEEGFASDAQRRAAFASGYKEKGKKKDKKEDVEIQEDGHTDVASAMTNVKVAMSALTKMSGELAKLSPEDALPSWWTNKVAVAVDKLDGMADYLDTQVEALDKEDEPKVKEIIKKLKKASDAHAGQSKDLEKAVKEEVELDEGKMKELAMKIADVYTKMKKDKQMKPFADKFRADVKTSLNIKKSLEKVLPDYIAGKEISKLMSEEVELDEKSASKSATGYDIYHKDFSSALQHATAFAKSKGQPIKKSEIDDKIATGPRKPSKGKENSYTLETEKGKMWSVQVYNMGNTHELNMYLTSSYVPEEVELDEMKMNDPKLLKMFDKLKKGDKIKLKTSSTISKGKDFVEYIVKSKNTVNKGKVEKITLATVGNEKAVKKFLYKRDGTVGFAIGDMGASIDDIKESTNEVPENMAAYLAAITKQLGER